MRFVVKRLVLFVAALIGLSALVFVMLRVLPGDVAAVIAGTNATPERIASLRDDLGLNKPLVAQYGDWMLGLLHGNLGVSAVGGRSVAGQVVTRMSVTFPLIVLSLLIALAIGLPLGCSHCRGSAPCWSPMSATATSSRCKANCSCLPRSFCCWGSWSMWRTARWIHV